MFKSYRGSIQHLRYCKVPVNEQHVTNNNVVDEESNAAQKYEKPEKFYWAERRGSDIEKEIEECYEKIVFWKRTLFLLPNGATGKNFVQEITRLLNAWYENSPLKDIAMKAIHIMPALLLQKPAKASKTKDHIKALERRMSLWHKGEIEKLFDEAEAIQSRLPKPTGKKDIAVISKQFKDQMQRGNVNGAIKIITNNMTGGILPLNDETLEALVQKHPNANELQEDVTLQGPIDKIHPIIFNIIDEDIIIKAVKMTKGGGSGPSGLDAKGWRKIIIISKVYGDYGKDLRKMLANCIKKMCQEKINDNSLEAYLACRLVPLDKKPGLRPISVGEVLRWIAKKVVAYLSRKDVIESCSDVQMCSWTRGWLQSSYSCDERSVRMRRI